MASPDRALRQTIELLEVVASWFPEHDDLRQRLDTVTEEVRGHRAAAECPICHTTPCEFLCPLWDARKDLTQS